MHVPPGTPETSEQSIGKPQFRVFILGPNAESTLPPHAWEQLALLFPAAHLHIFFIGPQVGMPKGELPRPDGVPSTFTSYRASRKEEFKLEELDAPLTDLKLQAEGVTPSTPESNVAQVKAQSASQDIKSQAAKEGIQAKPNQSVAKKEKETPMYWEIMAPPDFEPMKNIRSSDHRYGHRSYTLPFNEQMSITGIRANYLDVHAQFEDTLDPYSDVFFFFHPGFGLPSVRPGSVSEETGEPLLAISSPTEWAGIIPRILESKCPMFVTGSSPADLERDVKALNTDPEIENNYDWVITPGPNTFLSERWLVNPWDFRIMTRHNWGIWGIRGKTKELVERPFWEKLLSIGKPNQKKETGGIVKS